MSVANVTDVKLETVAICDIKDISKKNEVVSIEPIGPDVALGGEFAPEGLAYFEFENQHYIISANKKVEA